MKSERDGVNPAAKPSGTVAPNAWLWADGGCIFADAPNALTSAAVIVRQISMHRNIAPQRVTRSSRASSRAAVAFRGIADMERLSARDDSVANDPMQTVKMRQLGSSPLTGSFDETRYLVLPPSAGDRLRDITSTIDEALGDWGQHPIFQRHDRDRPCANRKINRQCL
jgi:hypothetical protein